MMSSVSVNDRISIIKCYYTSGSSARAALRKFKTERHLIKDPFTTQYIQQLVTKFETTGSVIDKPKSGRPSLQDDRVAAVEEACRRDVSEIGCNSTRRISRATNIPHTSVYHILRDKLRLYPYKFSMLQELKSTDAPLRLHFANWLLENSEMLDTIMWTDECHFYMNGAINTKNCVIWSDENPRAYRSLPLHSGKVTVWIGISKHCVIQPFIFEDTVNGERYLNMLNDHLLPELRRVRKVRSTIFMQDGAPAHILNGVKQFLTQHFGDRIISRHFPNFWPPRSPDLNPCDYWLWGYLQSKVYQRIPPKDKNELILRIREAIRNITKEMTAAAIDNVLKRLQAVVDERGGHFQHLL